LYVVIGCDVFVKHSQPCLSADCLLYNAHMWGCTKDSCKNQWQLMLLMAPQVQCSCWVTRMQVQKVAVAPLL
jgi:hypothetical protein